jgi:hypothetical protein
VVLRELVFVPAVVGNPLGQDAFVLALRQAQELKQPQESL